MHPTISLIFSKACVVVEMTQYELGPNPITWSLTLIGVNLWFFPKSVEAFYSTTLHLCCYRTYHCKKCLVKSTFESQSLTTQNGILMLISSAINWYIVISVTWISTSPLEDTYLPHLDYCSVIWDPHTIHLKKDARCREVCSENVSRTLEVFL